MSNLNKNTSDGKFKLDDQTKSKESLLSKDDYKFEIPDTCFLIFMKGNQIEKLHKKYLLVSHPFPKIEGEMIVFQPIKQD